MMKNRFSAATDFRSFFRASVSGNCVAAAAASSVIRGKSGRKWTLRSGRVEERMSPGHRDETRIADSCVESSSAFPAGIATSDWWGPDSE